MKKWSGTTSYLRISSLFAFANTCKWNSRISLCKYKGFCVDSWGSQLQVCRIWGGDYKKFVLSNKWNFVSLEIGCYVKKTIVLRKSAFHNFFQMLIMFWLLSTKRREKNIKCTGTIMQEKQMQWKTKDNMVQNVISTKISPIPHKQIVYVLFG